MTFLEEFRHVQRAQRKIRRGRDSRIEPDRRGTGNGLVLEPRPQGRMLAATYKISKKSVEHGTLKAFHGGSSYAAMMVSSGSHAPL